MNNLYRINLSAVFCSVVLAGAFSGCLKTRPMVREEARERPAAHPAPVAPQPVAEQNNYLIDELRGELTRMNGRIEDLERDNRDREKSEKLKSTSNEGQMQKERNQQLEARLAELEKAHNALIDSLKKAPPPDSSASNPEDFLKKARAYMEKAQHSEAIENLNSYLRNPKAKLIQEATFLKGEAYFAMKEFKKSITEFSKFQDSFKNSKKLPAALYRIAQCFEGLKSKDDAKAFYQEVAEKFPTSPEGKKAKAKIK